MVANPTTEYHPVNIRFLSRRLLPECYICREHAMSEYLRLVLAVFTCYRLARLVALDDGPFFIFKRLRYWLKDKAYYEAAANANISDKTEDLDYWIINDRWFGKWHNLAEGISCPFCIGTWASLFIFPLLVWPTQIGDLFLLLVSLSGMQAFLQTLDKE